MPDKEALTKALQSEINSDDPEEKLIKFPEPDVWIFCDGTPHDEPEVKKKDKNQRSAIMNRGDQVFVYYYQDKLEDIIGKRPDIFKKVK